MAPLAVPSDIEAIGFSVMTSATSDNNNPGGHPTLVIAKVNRFCAEVR